MNPHETIAAQQAQVEAAEAADGPHVRTWSVYAAVAGSRGSAMNSFHHSQEAVLAAARTLGAEFTSADVFRALRRAHPDSGVQSHLVSMRLRRLRGLGVLREVRRQANPRGGREIVWALEELGHA